eukprot:3380003-Pleurochrysis_carterae.AAC.1
MRWSARCGAAEMPLGYFWLCAVVGTLMSMFLRVVVVGPAGPGCAHTVPTLPAGARKDCGGAGDAPPSHPKPASGRLGRLASALKAPPSLRTEPRPPGGGSGGGSGRQGWANASVPDRDCGRVRTRRFLG